MNKTLSERQKIYDHIQDHSSCGWHQSASSKEFERYCIAKDTIQDTGGALLTHREKGFPDNIYLRYVEYYGVLQAVYMQQDAIHALYRLFMSPPDLNYNTLKCWNVLRDLRDDTVGHPVGRLNRFNRNQITYECVNYMRCPTSDVLSWESTNVNLADLLDGYDLEAAGVLEEIHFFLETECERKHSQQ